MDELAGYTLTNKSILFVSNVLACHFFLLLITLEFFRLSGRPRIITSAANFLLWIQGCQQLVDYQKTRA